MAHLVGVFDDLDLDFVGHVDAVFAQDGRRILDQSLFQTLVGPHLGHQPSPLFLPASLLYCRLHNSSPENGLWLLNSPA